MKDRISTQISANGAPRYGIYDAQGNLQRYEYIKPEDAPSEAGTPLNKANMLSDATVQKLWPIQSSRPAEPTVNDALNKLADPAYKIGDIRPTAETLEEPIWLEADGRFIEYHDYPSLWETLRTNPTVNWYETAIGATPYSITHSDNIWVAVTGDGYVYTAENPRLSWTRRQKIFEIINLPNQIHVKYGGGYFVAVCGENENHLRYTNDPTGEWEEYLPFSSAWYGSLAYMEERNNFVVTFLNTASSSNYFFGYIAYKIQNGTVEQIANGTFRDSVYRNIYGYTSKCVSEGSKVGVAFSDSTWNAIAEISTDGSSFTRYRMISSTQQKTVGAGFNDSKFYVFRQYQFFVLDVLSGTYTPHDWEDILPVSSVERAFLQNGTIFAFLSSGDLYRCSDLDALSFEHDNVALTGYDMDYKSGMYAVLGSKVFTSTAEESTKPIPTIPTQYGVKSYIKALEG